MSISSNSDCASVSVKFVKFVLSMVSHTFATHPQFVFTMSMKTSPALDISPAPTTSSVATDKEEQFIITRLYGICAFHSIVQFCNITVLHAGIEFKKFQSIEHHVKS